MTILKLNSDNFEKEVKNSDLPVIIDFWAPWCGPCKMMGPIFEDLANEFEGKMKFARLNTQNNPEPAQQFNVTGIPTSIFFKDGKEIDRVVGLLPKKMLKQKIQEHI